MLKKGIHIIILCLFVVATAASPAYASCQCDNMTKEDGMNMPCHQASDEEPSNDDNAGGCCDGVCGCATGCTSASISTPEASYVINSILNKYSISPAESLSSVVHAVPGSPPKRLS